MNLRCESIYPTFVYQHKIYFQTPGEWETLLIPFRDFVLTSHGYIQKRQMIIDRSRLKSVGFSIMRQPGEFRLEIDSIEAINLKNTIGDLDCLEDNQYIDENGVLKTIDLEKDRYPLFPKAGEYYMDFYGNKKVMTEDEIPYYRKWCYRKPVVPEDDSDSKVSPKFKPLEEKEK